LYVCVKLVDDPIGTLEVVVVRQTTFLFHFFCN
jgi:hypothetical protein